MLGRPSRNHRRSRLSQLFKLSLNFRPGFGILLGRIRSIGVPVEFQHFSAKVWRSATKVLFCERVEQLCVRLIIEPILSGPSYLTGVKIVVWQVHLAGAYLA